MTINSFIIALQKTRCHFIIVEFLLRWLHISTCVCQYSRSFPTIDLVLRVCKVFLKDFVLLQVLQSDRVLGCRTSFSEQYYFFFIKKLSIFPRFVLIILCNKSLAIHEGQSGIIDFVIVIVYSLKVFYGIFLYTFFLLFLLIV